MGVGTILEARRLMLLATGESKAAAVAAAIEGPVTSMITASALQLHRDVVVLLDRAAASKLKMIEYYDWIEAKRPGAPSLDAPRPIAPPHFARRETRASGAREPSGAKMPND